MKKEYHWSDDFSAYINTMTWGHGFAGEKYWKEEEGWIKAEYQESKVDRSLSVGCGLFRELDTLRKVTTREVIGLEPEQKFVDYMQETIPLFPDLPSVRIIQDFVETMQIEEKIDLVAILFNSLSFFTDRKKALNSIVSCLSERGEILISVWNDDNDITDLRLKTYTQTENKTASVEEEQETGLKEIVVKRQDDVVFRSAIFTQDWLSEFVKEVLPHAEIVFFDHHFSTIVKISSIS